MKEFIKGKVVWFSDKEITIENQGIGHRFFYLILKNDNFKFQHNQKITLYIAIFYTEFESIDYAFINQNYRDLFLDLIKIKSVGPKTAINLLTHFLPEQWMKIIQKNDLKQILTVKGVGAFTGNLILNELNKKYFDCKLNNQQMDVALALEKMGYSRKEIYQVLKEIEINLSLEQMLKLALEKIGSSHRSRI